MSAFITLANDSFSNYQAAGFQTADDGLLDWVTSKNTETQVVLRGVAITLGVIFVIIQAVVSRGAMARIIISLLAAGVFIWGVWNITDIKDRVDSEMSLQSPPAKIITPPSSTGLSLLA